MGEIHEFFDPEPGEIRIGFPHSLVINLLPAVVAAFKKNHPNVKFRLRQGTYTSLIRDVSEGRSTSPLFRPFQKHTSMCLVKFY